MTAFVSIPAGPFMMGNDAGRTDERPSHPVWLDAFEIAVYPVTRAEYEAFLQASRHEPPRDWAVDVFRNPEFPVIGVSWNDAQAYCAWHTIQGSPMRLPTEAEWERAAAGTQPGQTFPWGDTIPAWIPNAGKGPLAAPWPVWLGEPNAIGIYGIAANVHEWCADWYAADFYAQSPERNPSGPAEGVRRASRGGSWRHAITISRTTARSGIDPSFRYTDYGFRVARGA